MGRALDGFLPAMPAYTELAPPSDRGAGVARARPSCAGISSEWIWFEESDPAETAVERARFEVYGIRSARPPAFGKLRHGAAAGCAVWRSARRRDTRWIPELLLRSWLRRSVSEPFPAPQKVRARAQAACTHGLS